MDNESAHSGPTTRAGVQLRAAILARAVDAGQKVESRRGERDLIWSCAFTIAVRRRFATVGDIREIARYVAGALPRQGMEAGGRQARAAEGLIRWVLGEREMMQGILRPYTPELAEAILLDLARLDYATPGEVDLLVAAAESEAARSPRRAALRGARGVLAVELRTGWRAVFDGWRRRAL